MNLDAYAIDPALDLVFDRVVPVSPERVWRAWTRPEHLLHWFTPAPWRTTAAEVDLRPGGRFFTIMEGPAGEKMTNLGCYLEVVENSRLVWTDAMHPGFRPAPSPFMTGIILMEAHTQGARYVAIARHKDEATRAQHEQMGFHDGWGAATDQLVAHMQGR